MGAKILYVPKFVEYLDLAQFAQEIDEEWKETLSGNLEDADEALLFFEACMNKAGLNKDQKNYVLYKLGY